MNQHRLSEDSAISLLSNSTDEGPKDRDGINQLLRDARTAVDEYVKGSVIVNGANLIMADKVLHVLMQNAPNEQGQRYVAHSILKYKGFNDRRERKDFLELLAKMWLMYLLYPVHASHRDRVGIPSLQQTPTYNDTATLIEGAIRGNQDDLRTLLERRHGHSCAVSGTYNYSAPSAIAGERPRGGLTASHILLLYTLNGFTDNGTNSTKAAISWDMLKSWTALDVHNLSGAKINGAANAILLRADLDFGFGNFKWWFDRTDHANIYKVTSNYNMGYNDQLVAFTNDDVTENIDLPDPEIIKVHAAFCQVFYASGADKYFEALWQDNDSAGVLLTDGSSDLTLVDLALQRNPV